MAEGEQIRINGVVQGVGFRPHVWRLAREYSLTGVVRNEGGCVVIEVWGAAAQRDAFVAALQRQPPPLAKIESFIREPLPESPGDNKFIEFIIEESRHGAVESGLSADAAICDDCLQELLDRNNRRYRYPFINCTHCGPRLSIARSIPYDRHTTSMAGFPLCNACTAEYVSPTTRRFHAQVTACPECGPRVWLTDSAGHTLATNSDEVMSRCAQLLAAGKIVAIKGMGGFHLACDATNDKAVQQLRRRKQRPDKPFAVMVTDLTMAHSIAHVSESEERLLRSAAAPIVLLESMKGGVLSAAVAPAINTIGCMLAYTGLHHLLLEAVGRPLVMTSGNRRGELLLADNEQAQSQLAEIADYFLLHDREIVHRLDDSVVRLIAGEPRLLRRARGYVPTTLALPEGFESADGILAMGAEIKNSFCLLHRGRAMLSPYMGELSVLSNYEHYSKSIDSYSRLFQFSVQQIVIDAHPEYHATRHGTELAAKSGLSPVTVQHHHAHIAACMAEHGLPLTTSPVLGVALDGIGYGDDDTLWGGEFLLADYRDYQRLAAFDAVSLPGGDTANREPWRNAFAHLHQSLGWEAVVAQFSSLPVIERLQQKPFATLQTMIAQQINSPLSSSCGRLFDGAAALLGICFDGMSYEGQAAMQLEHLAASAFSSEQDYTVSVRNDVGVQRLTWESMWRSMLQDLKEGVATEIIAARFHHTIINAVAGQALWLMSQHSTNTVVLTGGAFQNRLLAEGMIALLAGKGVQALLPAAIPANDGGIALGQAVIASAHNINDEKSGD
jgi:hydrogenase maturation protein HypF